MNHSSYPPQLQKFVKKYDTPQATQSEENEVREMRLQDTLENNSDPNDMPLEIEKNLKTNLGPIDTEAEVKKIKQEKEDQDQDKDIENSPLIHP